MNKESNVNNLDSLVAIVVIMIGIIYGFGAYKLPRATIGSPLDPIYFPVILSIVIIFLGIILFAKSDFAKTKRSINNVKNMDSKTKNNAKTIFIACVICILYTITFERLGFVISTCLFMVLMLSLTNKKQWKKNTIVALSFSISVYVIFAKLLAISLPPMPFLYI